MLIVEGVGLPVLFREWVGEGCVDGIALGLVVVVVAACIAEVGWVGEAGGSKSSSASSSPASSMVRSCTIWSPASSSSIASSSSAESNCPSSGGRWSVEAPFVDDGDKPSGDSAKPPPHKTSLRVPLGLSPGEEKGFRYLLLLLPLIFHSLRVSTKRREESMVGVATKDFLAWSQ